MRSLFLTKMAPVLMLILLSGCSVHSSQFTSLLSLFREPSLDLSANSWLVRYSGYESVIYAVSTRDGILFSNNAGDQVLFDGWTLRKVQGMGRRQINMTISDKKNIRIFKSGDRIISNHRCDQWEQQKNQGVVRYTQYCSDKQIYKNSILVKEKGDISVIRQIVDERYTALTLTKLK